MKAIVRAMFEKHIVRKTWGSDYYLVQIRYNRNMTPEEGAEKLNAFRDWRKANPNTPTSEYHDKAQDFLGDNPFPLILQKLYGLKFTYDRENHFYCRYVKGDEEEVQKVVTFCENVKSIFEWPEVVGALFRTWKLTWRPSILWRMFRLALNNKQFDDVYDFCCENVNVHCVDGASLYHSDLKNDLGIGDVPTMK